MYEYKIFNWSFDLRSKEDLEDELKKYKQEGWNLFNIVSALRRSGSFIPQSDEEKQSTVILERVTK